MLSVTGTRDEELGGASWTTRTEPYRNMPAGCKWLAVIDEATHMNFAGYGASRGVQTVVLATIAAFADGVQRGNCAPPPPRPGLELEAK